MADAMAAETLEAVRENIIGRTKDTNPYTPRRMHARADFCGGPFDANALAIVL